MIELPSSIMLPSVVYFWKFSSTFVFSQIKSFLFFLFTQERVLSLASSLQSFPPRHFIKLKMINPRPYTAAQCVGKTSPTPLNFSVTYVPTQERGLSPARCVKRDFQKRGCSWSTKGSILGRNHSRALSVRKDLLVRGSSGCTGGHTLARGRITAPSVWRAFPDTGIWKLTWRRCTLRLLRASRGRSFHVRTVKRAVTQQLSSEIIRGLTPERGRTSALSVTSDLPCRVHLWDTSVSTPALHPTTAQTAGRHLRSSGRWRHTCELTQEKNRTAARSVISLSWLQESCGGTPGFTLEKSRTRAQTVGGTSHWQELWGTTNGRVHRTRMDQLQASSQTQFKLQLANHLSKTWSTMSALR